MHKTQLRLLWALAVVAGSLGFCAAHAAAQTGGDPAEGVADAANPPRYIRELVEGSALTQEQVDLMRADGLGWGEIRIATRLAEQIDAASEDPLVTFDTALAGVLAERTAGKEFGEIAQGHNLKIGGLVGKGSLKTGPVSESEAGDGGELEEGPADAANPPRYIRELVEGSALTQEQVDAMRADGLGWGEIRIATRLAEQIDAASEDPLVTFDTALAGVLAERAAGKGFGEIAQAHNLKIGELVGKGSQKGGSAPGEDPASAQAGETKRLTEKKRGLFARLGGALGLGKGQRQDQTLKPEGSGTKTRTMTRAAKVKTLERPTRPEKPEKPAKLERPERPARPEKPEKPERGPNR